MSTSRFAHPETPFPVGVEYYRGGTPKPDVWDGDFASIRESGFHIVRTASYWNWMEPAPGEYRLDDFDLLLDTAERHGLSVWLPQCGQETLVHLCRPGPCRHTCQRFRTDRRPGLTPSSTV